MFVSGDSSLFFVLCSSSVRTEATILHVHTPTVFSFSKFLVLFPFSFSCMLRHSIVEAPHQLLKCFLEGKLFTDYGSLKDSILQDLVLSR